MTTKEILELWNKAGDSNMEKAIKEAIDIAHSEEDLKNVLTGLQGEFKRFKLDKLSGTLDHNDQKKTLAQLSSRFIGIIGELKNTLNEPVDANQNSGNVVNSTSTTQNNMKDVFISYSTKDQEWKTLLAETFEKEGITYWLDETSLTLGENIQENIQEGLKNSRFTVLLVSENSLLSTWVSMESLHRLKQEIFEKKTTFLPVIVDTVVFNDDFTFDMYDKFKAEIDKQKEQRRKAEERNMKTGIYNTRIERLEEILPDITNIIAKITEGLSANFTAEPRRTADLQKLINAIKQGK